MEDNYDEEEEEEEKGVPNAANNATTNVANQQPTVPMTKIVQPTTIGRVASTDKGSGGDVLVHHNPSMQPGKILRFTELMHPQKSLEEEREIAREKRRQRKKEREEEEDEEEAGRRLGELRRCAEMATNFA